MDIFNPRIESDADVRAWCFELAKRDLLWHFDDDLFDVGDRNEFGEWVRLFTDDEAIRMGRVLDRVFKVSHDPFLHAGDAHEHFRKAE